MNMLEAVQSVLKQYFGFSGRARRSEFWFWILASFLVAVLILVIEMSLGISTDGSGPISTVFFLATFFPDLAVTFRRLHDTGRSGWWIGGLYLAVIAYFILIGVMIVGAFGGGSSSAIGGLGVILTFGFIAIFVYGIVLLIFCCQDSAKGPNKYGPNPKNEGNYDVFE